MAQVEGVPFRLGQRPGLDGLRAIAILAVIGYHDGWLVGGFLGVDLFFALSGFLITSLLLEEWEAHGRIAIGRFYARRFLRLAPALLVFVAVLFLTTHVLLPDLRDALRPRWALAALLYWANVLIGYCGQYPLGVVSICWSLAQEEQFYLLWPLALRTLVTRRVPRLAAALGAAVLCLTIAALRHWLAARGQGDPNLWLRIYFAPDTRADAILVGCALALFLSWRPPSRRAVLAGSVAACLGLAVLGRLGGTRSIVEMVGSPALITLAAWSSAAVVFGAIYMRPLVRLLEFGPLVWIGKLSYSLYLWHAVGLEVGQALGPRMRHVVVLALAVVSHYLVERPFLRLKARLAPGTDGSGVALRGWLRRTGPAFAAGMAVLLAVTAAGYGLRLRASSASGPEAIQKARERVASHPGDAQALRDLARVLSRTGDARGAVGTYRELLKKGASGDDLTEMGFAFLQLGQTRNAEVCFRKVLSQEPERLRARLGLGEALLAAGRAEEAAAAFTALLAADPGSAVAHDRIAAAYAQLGSLDRAIAHLSEAARLDPRPERLASLESARRDAASRRNDAGP